MKHSLHPIFRSLVAASLIGAAGLAAAQTVTPPPPPPPAMSTPSGRLVSTFTPLAGSEDNASSLVTGLRTGSPVTLTGPGPTPGTIETTTFTAPTKPMGYGNIRIAMSLAEARLAQQGITNPTPAQLQGALMGTTTLTGPNAGTTTQGILQMRASGMGWGQIAHSQGVKLGPVMSGKQTFTPTTTTAAGTTVTSTTTAGKSSVTTAAGHAGKGGVTTAGGSAGKSGVTTAGGSSAGSHGKSQVVTAGGSGGSGGGVANAFGHGNNAGGASASVVSAGGGNGGGNAGGASAGKGGGKP